MSKSLFSPFFLDNPAHPIIYEDKLLQGGRKHDILRFDVSVDNVERVHLFQSGNQIFPQLLEFICSYSAAFLIGELNTVIISDQVKIATGIEGGRNPNDRKELVYEYFSQSMLKLSLIIFPLFLI